MGAVPLHLLRRECELEGAAVAEVFGVSDARIRDFMLPLLTLFGSLPVIRLRIEELPALEASCNRTLRQLSLLRLALDLSSVVLVPEAARGTGVGRVGAGVTTFGFSDPDGLALVFVVVGGLVLVLVFAFVVAAGFSFRLEGAVGFGQGVLLLCDLVLCFWLLFFFFICTVCFMQRLFRVVPTGLEEVGLEDTGVAS